MKQRRNSIDAYLQGRKEDPFGIYKQKKVVHKNQRIHN